MRMNIEELKRLAEAATPGPWSSHPNGYYGVHSSTGTICSTGEKISDALYIAAANPTAVLELIRQRDELLAALKDAREMVDDWGAYASNYMQEKHDLDGDLDRLDAVIAKAEG